MNYIAKALSSLWGIVAFIVSFKVFPFAWHCRVFHLYFRYYQPVRKEPIPASPAECPALFLPTIYTSTTPLGEIDIFGHKSNSTYFTDLDMSRGGHIFNLFRVGIQELNGEGRNGLQMFNTGERKGKGEKSAEQRDPFRFAVGGVTCSFRKQIKPRQKYEIWTRVLDWDHKWVYLVSHFVSRGEVTPSSILDWKGAGSEDRMSGGVDDVEAAEPAIVHAVAVTKIVFKEGRKTVRPDDFLQKCGLLPKDYFGDSVGMTETIEERRRKGQKLAENMAGLDDGFSLFDYNNPVIFARY